MATLYFKIGADYDKVIRLRDEIKKLENQLKSFGTSTPNAEIKRTEERLASSRQEFTRLATEAAKAGAVLEGDFKKKIYDASQTVNDLSEKIIAQRTVVREVQADVKRLGEAYRTALKTNPIGASGKKAEYDAARKALDEERAALFGLTQEQANARLSVKKLRDEYSLFKEESGDVKDAIGDITGQMKNWIAGIAGGIGIKEFLGQMIQVRGEFENIETSLKVLLGGDSEKLSDIMSQMKEYALISPLTTKDMASALQMMIGFGIQADEAITYLKALGDISMGDTVHFNSLALAFSQMSAAGKLMGQDLNQMINAGFNPLQQISEKTGKSIGELKDEMSKGAISAQMVQQAFIDATSAGGKFYGMAAEGAKTINGQISMLQESVDNMFNDMGQASEGIILGSIQAVTSLVENYQEVGKVIAGLVITYGVYRAAVITNITLTHGWAVAARTDAAAKAIQTVATKALTVAQSALNAVMKANPYVLLATAVAGVATAMWALHDSTAAEEKAQKSLNDTLDALSESQKKYNGETEKAIGLAQDDAAATTDRDAAMQLLVERYPEIIKKYIDEKGHLRDILQLKKEIAAFDGRKQREETVNTLKEKGENAYNLYNELAGYRSRQLSANNKFSQAELNRINEIRKAYKAERGLSRWANPSLEDMRDYYKSLASSTRQKYARTLTEQKISDFTGEGGELENYTDEQLKALKRKLRNNQTDSKKKSAVFIKELDDYLTYSDRESLLTRIDGMIEARGQEKSTPSQRKATLGKELEDARKALADFDKSSTQYTANEAEKERKKLQDAVDDAEKRYKAAGGTTQTDKQRQSAATKAANERKKEAEQRKKAQEELNKDLLALQQQNQDDEIALMQDGTEKRLAEIDNDYKKRIAEIDKQEAEFKKKNQEAGATGLTGGLTKEQQTALQEARDNAAKEQRKQVKEVVDEENDTRIAALQNYLKAYGDYEQKRIAITDEYNKKIADATSQVEKTSLQAELEKTLSELDFNEFKENFNWEDIFGNLGDLTLKQLEGIRAQLRTLLADGSLGVDEYKTVVEQIGKVNEAIISEQDKLKDTFGLILPMAEERRKLELDVAEANARQNELLAEQQELLNGIETKRQDITTALQNAGLDINASDVNIGNQDAILSQLEGIFGSDSDIYKNVSKSFDELNKSERDLNNTTQKLDKAQADATSAQSKLNKFISDFGNKLQAVNEIMSLVSSNMQSLPDLFSQLGVDMDSAFGKGITDLANASQSATSAMQDAMSGNFVGALSNGIGAVKGVLSGFNNILGLGIGQGNAKETMERIDRLTESNDYLRTSIDRLTEKMDEAAGGRAIDYYEEALKAQERMNENYQDILDSSMRYTGAHHSNAYYWNLDDNSLRQVNALLGTSLTNSWDDFSKLTAEQMDEIRTHLPDIWEEMINQGKYGGDRFRDAWEDYADQAGKVEELTEQINENLTQTSFDSLRSNFLDTLMDMDADAQDFSDDFSEMMQRALLNFAMGDMLDDQLKDWYDRLAETISDNNGELSQGDIEGLRDEWQGMADEWLDMRDTISEITGYKGSSSSTQQSASSKGYETMSQDTGDAINGRMTAIYEAELRITDITTEQLAVLKAIYGQMGGNIADVASESKQVLSTSYIQQNNISFPTAQLDALVAKVEGLDAKVADLVSFGADNRLSMQGVDTYIEDATKNSTKSLSLLNDIKRNTQGL